MSEAATHNHKAGFALVVALSLMAFILLLLVSLSALVSVERQSASIASSQLQARTTALLAMQTALGDLQKHAGRDQRVTATASTLDSDPDTMDAEGIEEEYWTGIWDENGQLQSWLVSGNSGLSPTDADFFRPDNVVAGGTSFYEDGSVHAPLVLTEQGAYAFWVEDEGVKAKVSLQEGTASTVPLVSAQKLEVSLMSDLDWLDGALSKKDSEKLFSSQEIKLITGIPAEQASIDTRLHDLSLSSFGLLSDPVNGGLKQDLTLALYDNSNLPTGQIFDPISGGAPSLTDPGGPLWQQLQSWAQTRTTSLNTDGSLSARPSTDVQTGIFPVITQLQYYILPRYSKETDASGAHILRVYLEFYPTLTLWNPYDRVLDLRDLKIDIGRNFWDYSKSPPEYNYYHGTFYGWGLLTRESNGSVKSFNHQSTPRFPASGDYAAAMHFTLGNLTLDPGESVVYSVPSGGGSYDLDLNTAPYYPLSVGFRDIDYYAYATDITLPYDPADSSTTDVQFILAAHRTISLSVRLLSGDDVLQQVFWLGGVQGGSAPWASLLELGTTNIMSDSDGAVGVKSVRNFTGILGESGEDTSIQWLAHQNPRAALQGVMPYYLYEKLATEIQGSNNLNPSFYTSSQLDGDAYDFGLLDLGNGLTVDSAIIDRTILYETPPARTELHGVGQLMQANLFYTHADVSRANAALQAQNKNDTGNRLRWWRFDNSIPAYAIGNSEADPRMPLNSIFADWDSSRYSSDSNNWASKYAMVEGRHYDHSFLLNQALWDGYFFSALPGTTSRQPGNERLVALDATQATTLSSLNSAAEFMVDGAFNVNSTSEEAWRAVLGAFFGEPVESQATDASPLLRVHDNPGVLFDPASDDTEDESAYHGYRALTRAQIANLARQIVKQIKWRALGRGRPFVSMADFVNRDPTTTAPTAIGDTNAFRLRGALSAALTESDSISSAEAGELGISQSDARVNDAVSENAFETTPRTEAGFTQEAQEGWRSEGLPGWLTQADLLARLGPVLTSRSDTFTIRAYGEARDPITDAVTGKAWCEATVQRLPEYVDADSDSADVPVGSLTSQTNIDFGRRFVLVDFHWVDEI